MLILASLMLAACLSADSSSEPVAPPPALWFENRGQWPDEFLFGMWLDGVWVGVSAEGLVFRELDSVGGEVRLHFEGVSNESSVAGTEVVPGVHHSYRGSDPSGWVRGVRTYRSVTLSRLHAGIDLVISAASGGIEYDLLADPSADLGRFVVSCEGSRAGFDPQGRLTPGSRVLPPGTPAALAWLADGASLPLEVHRRTAAESSLASRVRSRPAEPGAGAGPQLSWATYWGASSVGSGGSGGDSSNDAATNRTGEVVITGSVAAFGYLTTPGAVFTGEGSDDVFVAKFHQASGELLYSARLGSDARDEGMSVALDDAGRAVVVGRVWEDAIAVEFPTTAGAFDPTKTNPQRVSVVFRLSPGGDVLEYSTFLEGVAIGSDPYGGVVLAASGAAIVAGESGLDFPTTPGSFSPNPNGQDDVFVTRLDPTGSFLEWSTFVGGLTSEEPADIALGPNEEVVFVGDTNDLSYPVTPGAFQGQLNTQITQTDGIVTCLSADGSDLIWSTYLGGGHTDRVQGVGVLPNGEVVATGYTQSTDFPTTPGAFQTAHAGGWDSYVVRFDSSGSQLIYSTYVGGSGWDFAYDMETDASGVVTLVGRTSSTDYPVTPGAFSVTGTPGWSMPVARVHPDGSRLLYATYIGGTGDDWGLGVGASPLGLLTIAGRSPAIAGFPTTPQALFPDPIGGSDDGTITTLHPLLQGTSLRDSASASCLGPLQINASSMPVAGTAFSVHCSQTPPSAPGRLAIFDGQSAPTIVNVTSDAHGFVETDVGNLPATPGTVRGYRYSFRRDPGCVGAGKFAHSELLVVRTR